MAERSLGSNHAVLSIANRRSRLLLGTAHGTLYAHVMLYAFGASSGQCALWYGSSVGNGQCQLYGNL